MAINFLLLYWSNNLVQSIGLEELVQNEQLLLRIKQSSALNAHNWQSIKMFILTYIADITEQGLSSRVLSNKFASMIAIILL